MNCLQPWYVFSINTNASFLKANAQLVFFVLWATSTFHVLIYWHNVNWSTLENGLKIIPRISIILWECHNHSRYQIILHSHYTLIKIFCDKERLNFEKSTLGKFVYRQTTFSYLLLVNWGLGRYITMNILNEFF